MRLHWLFGILAAAEFNSVFSDSDAMYEGECVDLAQRVHSLTYDIDVASKKIQQLTSKMTSYAESEGSDEAEMAEHSRTLSISRASLQQFKAQALNVSHSLSVAQERASESQSRVSNTTAALKQHHGDSERLLQHDAELRKELEEVESKIRKNELRSQMLSNDIDSTNKTLNDSEEALKIRKLDLKKAQVRVKDVQSRLDLKQSDIALASKRHQDILSHLERSKRNLANTQQLLLSESHKKEIEERDISSLRMRIDGEQIDIAAKRHSLRILNETVLNQTMARLSTLKDEEARLLNASHATENHMRSLRFISNHSLTESSPTTSDDSVIGSLRQSLRQSRSFLSKNGYVDHLSFLDLEPDLELDSFKSESQLLSMQNQLRETEDEEFNIAATLNSTLADERKQESGISEIQSRASSDEKEMSLMTAALSNITEQVRLIKQAADKVTEEIRNETQKEKLSAKQLSSMTLELESIKSEYSSTLKSRDSDQKAFGEVQREIERKRGQLAREISEKLRSAKDQDANELNEKRLEGEMHRAKNMSDKVQLQITQLSAQLENETTKRAELLADVAQVSRRLEEKMHDYENAVAQVGKELDIVDNLKQSIQQSLVSRKGLDASLSKETVERESLQRTLRNVKSRMTELKCNV